MAGEKTKDNCTNPTLCVAATASEAKRFAAGGIKVDRPASSACVQPAGIDIEGRFKS